MTVSLDNIIKGFLPDRRKRIEGGMAKELVEYEASQVMLKDLRLTKADITENLDIKIK